MSQGRSWTEEQKARERGSVFEEMEGAGNSVCVCVCVGDLMGRSKESEFDWKGVGCREAAAQSSSVPPHWGLRTWSGSEVVLSSGSYKGLWLEKAEAPYLEGILSLRVTLVL